MRQPSRDERLVKKYVPVEGKTAFTTVLAKIYETNLSVSVK